VIGIARTSQYYDLSEHPAPSIYLLLYQFRSPTAIVHVRTAGEPLASDSGVMDSSTECVLARLRHFHARSAHDAHFVAGAGVLPRGGDDIHRITSGLPIIRSESPDQLCSGERRNLRPHMHEVPVAGRYPA
jgi:hypothetical protein